jgi:outer membrane protein assembly factor BamB
MLNLREGDESWQTRLIRYHVPSGSFKEVSGNFFYSPFECEMLRVSSTEVSLWDLDTGGSVWARPATLKLDQLLVRPWRSDSHLFIINKGLTYMSLDRGGLGWNLESKTYDINRTGQFLKAASIFLSAVQGRPDYDLSLGEADWVLGLFSNPLVAGDTVYFADKADLYSLTLDSGDVIWRRVLVGQGGTAALFRLSSEQGVLIQFGLETYKGKVRQTKNSYVSGFDLHSGEERWRVVPEPVGPIQEAIAGNGFCAFLSEEGLLYSVDAEGVLRSATLDFQPIKMVVHDNMIIVYGEDILSVLDPNSMRVVWETQMSGIKEVFGSNHSFGMIDILRGAPYMSNRTALQEQNRLWVLSGNDQRTLQAYNLATGTLERDIELPYNHSWVQHNHLVFSAANRVVVLPISSLVKEVYP